MTSQNDPTQDGLSNDDIRLCYRLFLNRVPSDSEVARMKDAHKTLESLRNVFLNSSEFASRNAPLLSKHTQQQAAPVYATPPQKPTANLQPCDADRVVFLHVPKCGGTTLHHILGQWFGPQNMHPERFNELYRYTGAQLASSLVFSGHYDFYATTLIPGPKKMISILRDPAERLISLYNFHRAHTPEIIERDNLLLPRWANMYDIDDYFSRPEIREHPAVNNMIVRVFSSIPQTSPAMLGEALRNVTMEQMLEQALNNLEKFAFIGFMDRYDEDVKRLATVLHREPLQEAHRHQVLDDLMENGNNMKKIVKQRPSQEARDSMEELIQYDRIFYARARELFA